jgi:signal transduction histidine kinase
MIAVLEQGISSVTHMLNSLLDLSKLESGTDNVELSQVNIADVLNTMVKEYKAMAASKGLTLVSDGPEELVVQTDPEKVHRIAQNLIVNALKYTQEGEIRLSWKKEPKRWLLLVRDTGPGMQDIVGSPVAQEMNKPDSSREQSFVTGPHGYKGEGIGLTIVKRLCDLLDAGISMESKLGAGTLFTVQFPLEYDHP